MTDAGTTSNRVGNGSRPNLVVAISQICSSAFSSSVTSLSINTSKSQYDSPPNIARTARGAMARQFKVAMTSSTASSFQKGKERKMFNYVEMTTAELIELLFKEEDRVTLEHIQE